MLHYIVLENMLYIKIILEMKQLKFLQKLNYDIFI